MALKLMASSSYKTDSPQPVSYGYGMIAAYGFTYILTPIAANHAYISAIRSISIFRQVFIEAVYRKAVSNISVFGG